MPRPNTPPDRPPDSLQALVAQVVDAEAKIFAASAHPGAAAQLDQRAAALTDALTRRGVNLSDPTHAYIVLATTDAIWQHTVRTAGPHPSPRTLASCTARALFAAAQAAANRHH